MIGKDLGLFEAGVASIMDVDFKKVYVNMRFFKRLLLQLSMCLEEK